ncbi:hypothetical protein [Rosenbergiella collisarenosi]|uniref:hypothetical protein n=1 Tax=Rosenbergiella collisarenosi TaxID=1544695 RepID=UPI001F4D839B|nr:hypothetical protein [Rosenbergiella collisarenosi]
MDRAELLQKAHKRLSTLRGMKERGNDSSYMPRGGVRLQYDTDIALMEAAIAHLKLRPLSEIKTRLVDSENAVKEVIETANLIMPHATPGDWWMDSHGTALVSFTGSVMRTVFRPMNAREKPHRHEATGRLSHWENDADASWISFMQPRNVKLLLDKIEQLESKVSALESARQKKEHDNE